MKYDIVYSVTAHESIECVYNLYENIVKYNAGLDVLVIFHLNEDLYSRLDAIPEADNLIFNPVRTDKRRFTQSLLWAHLGNFVIVRDLDFDIFALLASNCMFVRQVDYGLIGSGSPGMSPAPHELEQEGSVNFDDIKHEWFWSVYLQCPGIQKLFEAKRIGVNARCHEGAYIRKEVMQAIMDFCQTHIIRKIQLIDGLDWIEILFPSLEKYFTGRIGARYCKHFPFVREIRREEILEIAGGEGDYNIVKRVARDMKNEIRRFICTLP